MIDIQITAKSFPVEQAWTETTPCYSNSFLEVNYWGTSIIIVMDFQNLCSIFSKVRLQQWPINKLCVLLAPFPSAVLLPPLKVLFSVKKGCFFRAARWTPAKSELCGFQPPIDSWWCSFGEWLRWFAKQVYLFDHCVFNKRIPCQTGLAALHLSIQIVLLEGTDMSALRHNGMMSRLTRSKAWNGRYHVSGILPYVHGSFVYMGTI